MSDGLIQIDTPEAAARRERRPEWLRVRLPNSIEYGRTRDLMRELNLTTVCEEANCPNIGECWSSRHATVMLLGSVCTRACSFCNVKTGLGEDVDPDEPHNVARAVGRLALRHVVVTSVDRDDLPDGGSAQFVETIRAIREHSPGTTIEVLTPDFRRKDGAIEAVAHAGPDVYNHNLETVPRLYKAVRPGADYAHSLELLGRVKQVAPDVFTKSGIMVGLGETFDEVLALMDDLRAVDCDFMTIGQYLQPTPRHIAIDRYVEPDEFEAYEAAARERGFSMVSATPLTRSSYHADEDFQKLKAATSK